MDKSLTPATHRTYERAIKLYTNFLERLSQNTLKPFPASSHHVMLFVAHCYDSNLAASSVLTYISALSYFHKIKGFPDPTQSFVIRKCLQGYQKERATNDQRKPITLNILCKLIASLKHTTSSEYLRVMLKAMYLLAFHAFLRIGEFTSKSSSSTPILSYDDVTFKFKNSLVPYAFELRISGYKHSQGRTSILFIEQNCNAHICPVLALWNYFKLRVHKMGPIFSFPDGCAVSRSFFAQQLQLSLQWAGYDTTFYKAHSFRIGHATVAAAQGLSDDTISRLGRWSSSAVKNYIRIPVIHL